MRTGSISRAWSVGLIMWLKLHLLCANFLRALLGSKLCCKATTKKKTREFLLAQSTKTGTQWNVKQDISKRTTILLFCWTMLDIFRSNSIV